MRDHEASGDAVGARVEEGLPVVLVAEDLARVLGEAAGEFVEGFVEGHVFGFFGGAVVIGVVF